jgi:AcrR family transcriptional regulator
MPAVKGGLYGGVSADDRRQERRQRLLAAGLEVIGTRGWAATTVRAVCREAGLTSRFFYESFSSVDELAVTLFDDIFERTTASVIAAVEDAPPQASIRNRVAIQTFVRELTDDPRVGRFAFMEALGSEALTRRRLAVLRSIVEAVLVQTRRSRQPAGLSDTYREVVATVLVGGLAELLVAWMHGVIGAELPQVVEDYVQFVVATGNQTYGTSSAPRPDPQGAFQSVSLRDEP